MTPPTTAGSASGPTECPNCGGTGTVMFAGVPGVVNPKPMTCICRMPKDYVITTASNGSHFVSASPPIAAVELTALRAAVAEVSNDIAGYVAMNDTDMALQSFLFRCMDKLREVKS